MRQSKKILPLFSAILLLTGSLLLVLSFGPADAGAPPTRAGLYQTTENYNISLPKPTFYGSNDPYYTDDVDANTWDDVAIVVFLQSQNQYQKSVGTYNLDVAEMYNAAFIPLNGSKISTGTTRTVLFEDITAAWCGPCTGVIGAMDRLNHDDDYFPNKYIGIEYHASSSNDVYYTADSGSKGTWYNINYFPTIILNGEDFSVGAPSSSGANDTANDAAYKTRIDAAANIPAPISIEAIGGYGNSSAWVNFTIKVEDPALENIKIDANVALIQDAHPRRHNAGKDARLGWILNDLNKFRVFDITGSDPVISNVLPADDSVLTGVAQVSFDVTDADASDDKITSRVEVRPVGGMDWANIKESGDKFNWNTAAKSGDDYLYPDGAYEIRITAIDYWDETSEVTIPVTVLNPDDPTIQLNNQLMQDQLDDGTIEGEFDLIWMAEDDEDGTDVTIDLFYMRPGQEWAVIAEDLPNTGLYKWDTNDPRIPDNDRYRIMATVTDSDETTAEIAGNFEFAIDNPDPPTIVVVAPTEGKELSGQPSIRWTAEDDEDTQSKLMIDISISEDDGVTYTPLATGIPHTGSYKFDTTLYDDKDGYKVKAKVIDSTGRTADAESGTFSIYNNDMPECRIIEPKEEDVVSETITVEWSSNDQEDESEDMTYSLYYRFSGGTYWKELVVDEPNTGSFEIDTMDDFEEGDGVYTIRLLVTDSRGEISEAYTVFFTVYNPDAPEVVSAGGPTEPISKAASFTWFAEDPDPFETDGLKIWFYYSTDGVDWITAAEGLPNLGSYTLDVSGLEDGTYKVKMVVADCQEGDANLTDEYLFMDITVDNNDAPTIDMTSAPDPTIEHEDEISFAWTGEDPEGDNLYYTAYYRTVGDSGWTAVQGAFRIQTTSFTWDISTLPAGDYELKIVVVEDTRDSFEAEIVTQSFTVKEVTGPIVDDDDDDDVVGPGTSDSEGSGSLTLILAIVIILVVIIILGLIIGGLVLMNKRKAAATQLPPPGGLPQQQATGLPGQVETGQLSQSTPQEELPPAPAPGPQQPEPVQPEAPPQI